MLYVGSFKIPEAFALWFASGLVFTAIVLMFKAARFYLVVLETRPELR